MPIAIDVKIKNTSGFVMVHALPVKPVTITGTANGIYATVTTDANNSVSQVSARPVESMKITIDSVKRDCSL